MISFFGIEWRNHIFEDLPAFSHGNVAIIYSDNQYQALAFGSVIDQSNSSFQLMEKVSERILDELSEDFVPSWET